jgi:hypothetical protein
VGWSSLLAYSTYPNNEPIDKFNQGIDEVRYVCLAKVMVNRKRMVKVGRI